MQCANHTKNGINFQQRLNIRESIKTEDKNTIKNPPKSI
ncbi:hypothetical protein TPE_2271 [Treponema pedis str. T A4]|uniref:Uncharacterized protein n=1 Tax=Treponema pedis str. T A4 TaxID=1291379 RepID=S5ZWI1_9SPIR|nr:hypothetical protein TPE_2271 [Treponema pedis str. T A4]